MYKICLVEDEKNLQELLKTYLEKENYEVITFSKGEEVLDYIDKEGNTINLWILDIMLNGVVTGFDLIKKIKENSENVPVIFSSARDESIDKIMGLELGSDDYIAKPYSPKELVLRVNKLIKRTYSDDFKKINYKNYEINLEKRIVTISNKSLDLTTLEFDLLIYLIKNKGKSLTREDILNNVWNEDYFGSDRVVDDLIRRLRKKMDLDLNTIYGYGYRLV